MAAFEGAWVVGHVEILVCIIKSRHDRKPAQEGQERRMLIRVKDPKTVSGNDRDDNDREEKRKYFIAEKISEYLCHPLVPFKNILTSSRPSLHENHSLKIVFPVDRAEPVMSLFGCRVLTDRHNIEMIHLLRIVFPNFYNILLAF